LVFVPARCASRFIVALGRLDPSRYTMRKLASTSLWLGHVGDVRDLRRLLASGIAALVDLALNEPPATVTRELTYCRFPLIDGAGNAPWLLQAAMATTAQLLAHNTPTLVYCGAGMSRTPAIAAAALSLLRQQPLDDCLSIVLEGGPHDVSPGLWVEVKQAAAICLAPPRVVS
jgi:hypothetical protein